MLILVSHVTSLLKKREIKTDDQTLNQVKLLGASHNNLPQTANAS